MRNKMILLGLVYAAFCGLLPIASHAEDAAMGEPVTVDIPPGTLPTATLEVEATQIRLLIGGAKGKGVLHFNGTNYPFTLSAGSIGGVGYAEVKATGEVYFLEKPEDLNGDYSAATAGVTAVKGAGMSTFKNAGNKVKLSIKSESEGLGLFLGIGAMKLELDK
ncbi:MAG TPA: hypothetical protein PKW44_00980 [Methylophilaceae bacterium]|nr:hypothetical protein [Methylophilaceae bacterium]HQR60949.1 hypothetical protein [Methylophilaceae bacterium]